MSDCQTHAQKGTQPPGELFTCGHRQLTTLVGSASCSLLAHQTGLCGLGVKGRSAAWASAARRDRTRLKKEALGASPAVMAACRGVHTMVLIAADSELWTFGRGDYGRLGHGDTEHRLLGR